MTPSSTRVLGISAFTREPAAALLVNGALGAAAVESRFARTTHGRSFPRHAIEYCLRETGIDAGDVEYVALCARPGETSERLTDVRRSLDDVLRGLYRDLCHVAEYGESRVAAAFFPSAFDEAAVLTLDSTGGGATAIIGVGRGNRVTLSQVLRAQEILDSAAELRRCARHAHAVTGSRNLVLGAPLAAHYADAAAALSEGPFDRVWLQPAGAHADSAAGAAFLIWHDLLGHERFAPDHQSGLWIPGSSGVPADRYWSRVTRAGIVQRCLQHVRGPRRRGEPPQSDIPDETYTLW